jgi:hypothetical protein
MNRVLVLAIALSGCGGESTPSDCSSVGPEVPSSGAALFTFLDCGGYTSFSKESAPHDTSGPHGGDVLVYVNSALEQSLAAGATEHPAGAAAIKELLDSDGSLDGWSAMVKAEAGAGGDTWYWYETFTTERNAPAYEGRGISICANCHSMGTDHFRSTFPLR